MAFLETPHQLVAVLGGNTAPTYAFLKELYECCKDLLLLRRSNPCMPEKSEEPKFTTMMKIHNCQSTHFLRELVYATEMEWFVWWHQKVKLRMEALESENMHKSLVKVGKGGTYSNRNFT
jgi:hypothetical protein